MGNTSTPALSIALQRVRRAGGLSCLETASFVSSYGEGTPEFDSLGNIYESLLLYLTTLSVGLWARRLSRLLTVGWDRVAGVGLKQVALFTPRVYGRNGNGSELSRLTKVREICRQPTQDVVGGQHPSFHPSHRVTVR